MGIGDLVGAAEEEVYLKGQSSGTFIVEGNESWNIDISIIHPVDCESVELTVVDNLGNDAIRYEYGCYEDDMVTYNEGDSELFASLAHETAGMEYTLNSNVDVEVSGSYCDDACFEAAVGGGLSAAGGILGICCAIPILIVGIVLAFTMDDPKTKTNMVTGHMQAGQIPAGQTMYQTPVTGQVPVAQGMPQTMQSPQIGQSIQPQSVAMTPIAPPLTQQPQQPQQAPVEQAVGAPVTPITPPLTQQPQQPQQPQQQAQSSQQDAWWGDQPQQ